MTNDDQATGKSPHAFMVEALGVKSRLLEKRQSFVAAALRAEREAFSMSTGYRAVDVDVYFDTLALEAAAARPSPIAWRN